ncbi:kinase-like domain-containing protein [Gaertneriomyces semiglobifer]|nr:kinase-like domain-containing protein [Gaertneriomyces semiglobifer]
MAAPARSSTLLTQEELGMDPTDVFEIVGKLGEGSYGSVHKALHKRTSTIVALKLIPVEHDLDDTIKEINIMQGTESRHVIQYFGSYIKDNYLWIALEYCGAGSVSDIMRITGHTLQEPQIAVICGHVLEGLKYLHDKRKIHRDIKAGNILLNTQGVAKLADFGVAGQLTDNQAKRNTVIGTPFWMAPEVIQEVGYGVLADIWSLGITCIEMAEGRPPYHKIHPMRAIFMIPTKPPPRLEKESKWSSQFIDFIAQCLTKNPANRPSAEQLLQHPFIKNAPGVHVLSEIISEAMDLIAQGALESSDEEDENDNTSDNDEARGTIRPTKGRKAKDSTIGPGATARAITRERRKSHEETEVDETDPDAFGTVKLSESGRNITQPSSSGAAMLESDPDDWESGTMIRNGEMSGTMVVGTIKTNESENGQDSGYQPAFMQYMKRNPTTTSATQPKQAYDSTVKLAKSSQSFNNAAANPVPRDGTSNTTTTPDVDALPDDVKSLEELLELLDVSRQREIDAVKERFDTKRRVVVEAIEWRRRQGLE